MKKNTIIYIIIAIIIVALAGVAVYYLKETSMVDIFNWYRANLNYGTVALLMAIESSFIPFPSEIVVPPAAYFAANNASMNTIMVVVAATGGALIGGTINYVLALLIGRPLVYAFAESRLGKIFLLSQKKVDKAEKYFDDHGAISTFLGRLVPAVRQLISIPAGLARMNFFKFALYTSLGAGVWNAVLAYLGYWLSTFVSEDQLFEKVEYYNHYLTYFGYGLGVAILVFIIYNMLFAKRTNN